MDSSDSKQAKQAISTGQDYYYYYYYFGRISFSILVSS